MPMRTRNGCSTPRRRHCVELVEPSLHLHRHPQAGSRVLDHALRLGVAEERQDGVADELVDRGAMLQRDLRHLGEVLVEQRGQLLRLQALGRGGEVLDVGEEDRELLALGGDRARPFSPLKMLL